MYVLVNKNTYLRKLVANKIRENKWVIMTKEQQDWVSLFFLFYVVLCTYVSTFVLPYQEISNIQK